VVVVLALLAQQEALVALMAEVAVVVMVLAE
jgi:hypothetical protein